MSAWQTQSDLQANIINERGIIVLACLYSTRTRHLFAVKLTFANQGMHVEDNRSDKIFPFDCIIRNDRVILIAVLTNANLNRSISYSTASNN